MIDLKTLLRRTAMALAVVLAVLALLALGFRHKAARAFDEGLAAEEAGDRMLAIAAYDDAIRNYYPFSSHATRARDRLQAIADEFEETGRLADALDTRQILLSALCAVETGFSGNRGLIDRLESEIGQMRANAETLARDMATTGVMPIQAEPTVDSAP